jgi:hypothetical protein
MKHVSKFTIIGLATLAQSFAGLAQSLTTGSTGDAFLDAGKPTFNYGGAGTLALAPTGSSVGEIDSLLRFNLASIDSQFNTTYGAGNWVVTGLSLSLASNFGTAGANPGNPLFPHISGGSFGIDWISYDGWTEGTAGGSGAANGAVSYNSIPTLLGSTVDSLGTFTYTPPGNNVYAAYSLSLDDGLLNAVNAGGDVSMYLYATNSTVGYLFNSKEFGSNTPELTVTVGVVPEPGTLALAAMSIAGIVVSRKFRKLK